MDVCALNSTQTPYAIFSAKRSLFSVLTIIDSLKAEYLLLALKNGADVNETEKEFGLNFLQKCIIDEFSLHGKDGEDFTKMVQLLLDNGIDVNHQDVDGCTALHFAICEQQYDLAKLLLASGANPAIVDNRGETAYDDLCNLFIGADQSKVAEVEELLQLLKIEKRIPNPQLDTYGTH